MNKWFDLMNTSNNAGYHCDRQPYRSPNDSRLEWLAKFFFKELEEWERSFADNSQVMRKCFLSHQTYVGLRITTLAMIELIPYQISQAPGSYVLTKRLSQDPIEAFFNQMRQIGPRNEMPDVSQYSKNLNIIIWQKGVCQTKGSNVDYTIN